jgi:outer membrane lipoprotein SlyB
MKTIYFATCASVLALVGGCASSGSDRSDYRYASSTIGVVQSIDHSGSPPSSGVAGAVVGGVVGGVLGNQVGSGRGNDAATVAGAVGGAVVGSEIQKRNSADRYFVTVRMENGDVRTFEETRVSDLRVGQRVRTDGGDVRPL